METPKHLATVLVLGSKPNALIPPARRVYAANSAAGSYRRELQGQREIVCVASAAECAEIDRGDNTDLYAQKFTSLMSIDYKKVYLIGDKHYSNAASRLVFSGIASATIEQITVKNRQSIIEDLTGLNEPILGKLFTALPFHQKIKYLSPLFRAKLRQMIGYSISYPGQFRPSTGVLSLLLAIRDCGANSEFIISGVGVGNRNAYSSGMQRKKFAGQIPPHIDADCVVLEKLKAKYRISTTDPELADAARLRCI